jgi:hypothetical protein
LFPQLAEEEEEEFPSFFGFFERFSLRNLPLFPFERILCERETKRARETTREKKKLTSQQVLEEREREKKFLARAPAGGVPCH